MDTIADKQADAADVPFKPLLHEVSLSDAPGQVQAVGARQESDEADSKPSCRICMDDEATSDNPLISPCLCAGSTRFIHRQCLAQWRATKAGTPAHYRCEICHFEYQFRRLWWARLLRHKATSVCAFLLLLLSASALLGFIPLIQALVTVPHMNGMGPALHMANGLLIFGIVAFVVMIFAAIAGYPVCGRRRQQQRGGDTGSGTTVWFWGGGGSSHSDSGSSGSSGDSGGAVALVILVVIALVGIFFAAKELCSIMFKWIRARLHDVEVMVENVGPKARKRAMDRAARKGPEETALVGVGVGAAVGVAPQVWGPKDGAEQGAGGCGAGQGQGQGAVAKASCADSMV